MFEFLEMIHMIRVQAMRTPDTEPTDRMEVEGCPPEHAGHDCPNPNCDAEQFLCREGRPDMRHSHVCAKCGTKWQHGPQDD